MKELNLEDKIYLCKYHDVDSSLYLSLGIKQEEAEQLIKHYKKQGIYEKYRNLSDEEHEKLIKKQGIKVVEKNRLLDLNDILFDQLHNLTDDSLTEQELKQEINRSKQVVAVSQTIINNADLLLQAKKHFDNTETKVNNIASLLRLE